MITLAGIAYDDLSAYLTEKGSAPHGEQEAALRGFMRVLERGLQGDLERCYYVLPLDPGMGKTRACISFVKAWRQAGYQPASSILIGLSTLAELEKMINEMGLLSHEFGVFTSKDEMNVLGLPEDRHGEARVLFTTQQMIRSRTKGRSFADAAEFHYQGSPRALRLWDESILPAAHVVMDRDTLSGMVRSFRKRLPAFANALDTFAASMVAQNDGDVITVPDSLTLGPSSLQRAKASVETKGEKTLLENLQQMIGCQMVLRDQPHAGTVLVGSTPVLPDDFAPVVVVDASARVRTAYQLWAEHRRNVAILPGAGHSFHNMTIHHWHRSSGKQALFSDLDRREIAEGIAEAWRRDPKGKWLVVSYKDTLDPLKLAVKHAIGDEGAQLEWLHWGLHTSTNAFRDTDNIVIVGQWTYPPATYEAIAMAASGLGPVEASSLNVRDVETGEHAHNLLQALCRASVRKSIRGGTARCNAFLITSLSDTETFLETLFPGHSYAKWREGSIASEAVGKAMELVDAHFATTGPSPMKKKDLRDAVGIKDASHFTRRVLQQPAFLHFLASRQLESSGQAIKPVECAFDPIDDD
ncbi:hypothetical protein [Novosphingobium beihaiensis]|uniref:Helicase/UvrB N-terminal domain-containing protein n=1 Tax=Novosphingobium beihaiensis TaxID=2930389 RepID=A0ABT0BNN1_9SPHN|nr:hypothetical protein [Novosphingobium beihaiensis]MCJ2186468.1 hypothetical protein [Novosphingobium beihaiensis]